MPTRSAGRRAVGLLSTAVTAGGTLTDGQLLERFLATRDEDAFAALVRRHGPMVLGVCRRVLRSEPDAEDAFQATFLVLARRASCVLPRQAVGNWLYGVACRTARETRRLLQRRRARERLVPEVPDPPHAPVAVIDDLALLDGELSRLPAKYRAVIVLCDLEGRSRREAARELTLPEGTLSSRLAAARKMLGERLRRRLLATSAACTALHGGPAVSASLCSLTVRAGLEATSPEAATSFPNAVAISERVVKDMTLGKLKSVTAVVVSCGLLVVGGLTAPRGGNVHAQEAPPATARQTLSAPTKAADRDEDYIRRLSLDLRGRLPSPTEVYFFVQSTDPKKRDRLIDLLVAERNAARTQQPERPADPKKRPDGVRPGPERYSPPPPAGAEQPGQMYQQYLEDYDRRLRSASPEERRAIHEEWEYWLTQKFLQAYPDAPEVPEALGQLGMLAEVLGKPQDATRWYQRLVDRHAGELSRKAQGALRRLSPTGQAFELNAAPLFGKAVARVDTPRKPTLIYFWRASRATAEEFDRIRQGLETRGKESSSWQIYAVNLDEKPETARRFLEEHPLPVARHLHAPGGLEGPTAVQYGLFKLPEHFLVDEKGMMHRCELSR